MDYIGYKCPVCKKNFHADDDIVVCPICGTPHHRACYEENNSCANEDRHNSGFDFISSEENSGIPKGAVKCKVCGNINPEGNFFCTKCRTPLTDITKNQQRRTVDNTSSKDTSDSPFSGFPFGGFDSDSGNIGNFPGFRYDPMAGVAPDCEFENGAKAGEVAKYVKQNTGYFMQVFNKIKNSGRSRFSFVGLIFGGGYLLYRKQYLLGTILTLIMGACLIFYTYSSLEIYKELSSQGLTGSTSSQLQQFLMEKLQQRDPLVILTVITQFINYAIHIFCGIFANRLYYNFCCKQVNKIKTLAKDTTQSDNELQTKGGVNMALGTSLLTVWILIDIVPSMLL